MNALSNYFHKGLLLCKTRQRPVRLFGVPVVNKLETQMFDVIE